MSHNQWLIQACAATDGMPTGRTGRPESYSRRWIVQADADDNGRGRELTSRQRELRRLRQWHGGRVRRAWATARMQSVCNRPSRWTHMSVGDTLKTKFGVCHVRAGTVSRIRAPERRQDEPYPALGQQRCLVDNYAISGVIQPRHLAYVHTRTLSGPSRHIRSGIRTNEALAATDA